MKKLLISFCLIIKISLNFASANVIDSFDLRFYHPENFSLRDLSFELRISNLMEVLKDKLTIENLNEVFFRVYWIFPGKYNIEVVGLPEGFAEIKNELKALVKNRLDYVIPQKLAPKVRSYTLTSSTEKNVTIIRAKDESNTKGITEIQLKFDNDGKLNQLKTISPMGTQIADMKLGVKSWSHNKWVLENIVTKTIQGIQMTTIHSDIEYVSVGGYGFPKEISIKTTQEIVAPSDKEKPKKREIVSKLQFSKYQVNSGVAQRFLQDQKKKK